MKNFHIAIVGGGVVGSAIARELSKYNVNIAVFEKGSDVTSSTSKANSGVVHSGINSPPDSLKARLCIEGNQLIQSLAKDLSIPIKLTGKFIIAKEEEEKKELLKLKKIGNKNGIEGLSIIEKNQMNIKEPNVLCDSALWVPSACIISPYQFTIALAENSVINGVKFFLETRVLDIKKINDIFQIKTNKGDFESEILINAAGLNCRKIVEMLETPDFDIYPCRGEYLVLDKKYSQLIKSMIYPIPSEKYGFLGIHITPTIEGNILLGPTSDFIDDIDDTRTTTRNINLILKEAKDIIPKINKKAVINSYSGIRCKITPPNHNKIYDFRIEKSKNILNFINLIGIESPGLTAAPAIAKEIVKIISKNINLKKKNNFISKYNKYCKFLDLNDMLISNKIKNNKSYGRIICRCENITEAEVINALSNPLGAKTISSVKYRCRAGMGRCQGGFCTQHIVRIMKDNFNIDEKQIKLKSPESNLFIGKLRE